MFKKTLIILAMLFAILGPGAKAWGQTISPTAATTLKDGGEYVIGTASTSGSFLTSTVSNGWGTATTDLKNAAIFTITGNADGFYAECNAGYLIPATSKTFNAYASEKPSSANLKLGTNGALTNKSSTSWALRLNTNFRWYSSTTGSAVYLFEVQGSSKTLVSIAISGTPNKTTYEAGESFDPAGLVVTGTYDDESQETITSGITWNVTPNPLTAGTTSVSVTAKVGEVESPAYQVDGLTVNQHVVTPGTYEIIPNNTFFGIEVQATGSHDPVTGTQNDITITHSGGSNFYCNASQIRTYKGNTLTFSVPTGYEITCIVLAVTDNASYSANVGTYTVSTKTWVGNANEVILTSGQSSGNYQITKITATFASTKTLTSIAIKTPPTKTTYNVGDNFNPAGLVITATYDDASTEDIAYEGNEDKFSFEPSTSTALTTANTSVNITYGEKSCNQDITVSLNKLATPTNLEATNIASTSATLTWYEVANASSYDVKLNGETKTAETNSLLVEELTASTTYTWTVKAKGDNTTYSDSDESVESSFTTPAIPTVAYTVTFDGNEHGTPASGSLTENPAGSGVTLPNCTPNAGYQFVGWATTETATEAEYKAGATYYPTENITLYAVYNEVYTITWSVNGTPTTDGNPTTSVVKGDGITALPTAPASISGMAFQGWTATQIESSSATKPTDLFTDAEHAPEITANTTFYAVFAEKSEGDVTWNLANDIAANDVIIIATNKNYNSTMKTAGTISSNLMSCTASTFNSDKTQITSVADGTLEFTLGGNSTSGWTLQNGINYLGMSGDKKVALSSTSSTWSISISSGVATVSQTYSSKSYSLQYNYNNGNDRFTGYTSGQTAISLYKKTQEITYTYYTNVVVKQLTSISLSGEYPIEFWKGDAFNHDGMIVTAHYSNADDADVTDKAEFTGYDMATAGEQTVMVTYEDQSKTYDITVKTIANTQGTAYTVAEAKELINAGNDLATEVFVAGKICKIDSYNSPFNSITYWISTDGTQDNMFEVYSGKNLNNTNFTSISDIVLQADVIVYGKIKKFNSTYEFDMNNYLVSYTVPQSYTITLNQSTGGTISADKETAAAGETVTITIEPASGYTLATLTGAAFNETVDPALLTYTFTMPAEEVTISATFNAVPTYTISFATNGIAETEATIVVNQGDAIGTLAEPTGTNIPNGYTFKGWSENEIDLTNVEPTYITDETVPTDDMTLYAVFAIEHKDIQETTSTMDFSEETYSDWIIDEDIKRTADQGTGGTGDYAGKINTNNTYITFNKKVKVESFGFSFKRTSTNENYNVYIETSTDDENWTARQTYPMKDFGNGSYTTKTDDTFDGKTDLYVRFHCYNTTANRYVDDVIIKYMGEDIAYSNFCTTVNALSDNLAEAMTEAGNAYYISTAAYVPANATVTINGVLTNTNAANLVIEDGGQLIFNNSGSSKDGNINSGVKATVEKNIIPYSSSKDGGVKGWHFLAAPMEDFAVKSFTDQANGNYDLYRWRIIDGTPTWYNYKAHYEDPYNEEAGTGFEPYFVNGRGYLAAYETTNLLQMQGTLNAGTEFEFTDELNGEGHFTLLGNPFTYDLNWSEFNNKTGIYDGFAVVDSKDGIIKYDVGDKTIKVGTGFMVYTEEEEEAKLSFKKGNGSVKSNDILALNLFASNGNGEDNTIIVIDDNNGGFAKADNFNTNVPQIYTERLQTKYGIRNFSTNTKEFFVSFKAVGEGSNTIRLETIGEFDYVHLYDKLTDVDVDMLLEGSYTFEASEGDDTHRFIVRIDKGNTGIDENETENFVNVYNGEIHVSGSGEVQIFDVMGRIVHSEVISGDATISTGGFKGGVYVVRLIGNGWTKTEKIVVRR